MEPKRVKITPKLAEIFLQNNTTNRPMYPATVEQYAKEMRTGHWRLTHQGILLGRENALIDGQHRLAAVIMSGVSVEMYVFTDRSLLSPRDLPVDRGRTRTNAFILGVDSHLTAVARLAVEFREGICNVGVGTLRSYVDVLQPAYETLMAECSTARAKVTVAPLQLAATVKIANKEDPVYVAKTYSAMAGLRYGELDPLPLAWLKQLTVTNRSGFSQREKFSRSMRAFTAGRKHIPIMLVKDPGYAFDCSVIELNRALGSVGVAA